MHVAVKSAKKKVVVAILSAGADINAMTDMHETPLDLAVRLQDKDSAQFPRNKGARFLSCVCTEPLLPEISRPLRSTSKQVLILINRSKVSSPFMVCCRSALHSKIANGRSRCFS